MNPHAASFSSTLFSGGEVEPVSHNKGAQHPWVLWASASSPQRRGNGRMVSKALPSSVECFP